MTRAPQLQYDAATMTPRAAKSAAKPAAKPANTSAAIDSVFDDIKTLLVPYAPKFTVREGAVRNKRDYHLILQKPLIVDGRQRDELWFASVIQQKNNVGFYFSRVYCDVSEKKQLSPELLKHLDGKACFHFKALTPELKKDIAAALRLGLAGYKKRGWL
jgi:hypothetical protein